MKGHHLTDTHQCNCGAFEQNYDPNRCSVASRSDSGCTGLLPGVNCWWVGLRLSFDETNLNE